MARLPPANYSAAFKLVRDILADGPRSFQEILQAGIAAVPSTSGTSSQSPLDALTTAVTGKGKGKAPVGKKAKAESAVCVVPDGHPFVSSTYLKQRILPILDSQRLITKSSPHALSKLGLDNTEAFTPFSSSSSSSSSKTTSSHKYHLTPPHPSPTPSSSTPDRPVPTWDTEAHWSRLLSSESPSLLAKEYTEYVQARKTYNEQARFSSGKQERGERDIWAWDGRKEGITTVQERGHLNVRRARGRPGKERRRLGEVAALQAQATSLEGAEGQVQA